MEEWRAKKKPTWDASCGASSDKVEELLRQLPPVTPSIPIQPNTWDCALYALQYAEDIFRKWPAITMTSRKTAMREGFIASGDSSEREEREPNCALRVIIINESARYLV